MKKLLCLLVVFIALKSTAQVGKGDLLIGGSFGFVNSNSSYSGSSGTSANVNFNPRISLGIGKNSILGTRLGYYYSNNKADGSSAKTSNTNFSAGLFWRKLIPIKGNLGWYPELGGNFYTGKSKNVDFAGVETTNSSNGYNVFVTPGLYYAVGPKFLINVDFGGAAFNHSKVDNYTGADSKGNSFQLSLFQTFNFGFDFVIGRHK